MIESSWALPGSPGAIPCLNGVVNLLFPLASPPTLRGVMPKLLPFVGEVNVGGAGRAGVTGAVSFGNRAGNLELEATTLRVGLRTELG